MSIDKKLNISDTHILDVCCRIEEACEDIYRNFSRLFADNPKAHDLWVKTSIEEGNHAEQFRLASRLKGSGIRSLKTGLYEAQITLAKINSINEGILKSPPSLKEALRFAIKLENSLASFHMDTVAKFEDEDIARLFSAMMNNDHDHILILEKAFNELC
jgi:rubrerythrin